MTPPTIQPADSAAVLTRERGDATKLSPRLAFLKLVSCAPVPKLPPTTYIPSDSPPSDSPPFDSQTSSPWTTPPTSPAWTNPTASPLRSADPILFTTDYFEVRKSESKGYGAFARKDIEAGTTVLVEKPLFKAEVVEIYAKLEQLTAEERAQYRQLCYWHKLDAQPTIARFLTNRFEISKSVGGIFIKSSRFNHACPHYKSCSYRYSQITDELTITAFRHIAKGEEITICYNSMPDTLYGNYGFHCDCEGCRQAKNAPKKQKQKKKTDSNDEPWLKPGGTSFGKDGSGMTDILYRHYRTFR